MTLDLDPARPAVPPRHASTLVVVREVPAQRAGGLEVFCVERQKVGFLGGAVVFPGGKLDPGDLDAGWATVTNEPRATPASWAPDEATHRGLAIAACREALEEAAILPVVGAAPAHADLVAWRKSLDGETTLRALLASKGLTLDLQALRPFARWITPEAESRRYDTRFFLFLADRALTGAHDDHETTASFWAPPAEVLRRFDAGELQLAPPTHRTLELLASARTTGDAVALADAACLDPICPRLVVADGTAALVLPGDPAHDVKDARVAGKSRFVLRGDRFVPEDAPA